MKAELEDIAARGGRTVKISIYIGDATKPESYQDINKLLETEYNGRLDCLVCNAGSSDMVSGWGKLHDTDVEDFAGITNLNYLGPYYAARYLIPMMLNSQSLGRTVINVTSGASHVLGMGPVAYSVSKLALNRLTQAIGESYAEEGLVAIALHPGAVMTPGAEQMPDMIKGCELPSFLKVWTGMLTECLVCQDDIRLCGNTCVWLSKEKRPWASGRYLSATWDMDELEAMKDDIVADNKLKFRMGV